MTAFLESLGLALVAVVYLLIVLVVVCGPLVLLCAAVRVLAKLVARLIGRRPSNTE
jgi:lauroyl/myristoyl acyltransferase